MQTQSRLLAIDHWCPPSEASEFARVIELLKNRIRSLMNVIQESSHQFSPQGETWLAVLSESHCALHTYPEHHYFSIDIYSCNPSRDLESLKDALLETIPCLRLRSQLIDRG